MDCLWREIKVPRRKEMHRDGDRSRATRKETRWRRIGKEEGPNPASHGVRNLDHSQG